jgi:hypothetical protein
MKNLRTILCCASICLSALISSAQEKDVPLNQPDLSKPELFKQSPDKLSIDINQVAGLLVSPIGETVIINLPSFRFEGKVISTVSKYENAIQSVVIRSTNFEGATLTISKTIDAAGNPVFTGRILSLKHGDLYELKQINNDITLVKNKFYSVVNE